MISVDARGIRMAAWAAVGASGALLLATLARGRLGEASIFAGFVLGAALLVSMWRRVPAVTSLAFALAVLYAGAGWTWGLFERVEPFDEIAHVLTGFALTPALAFLVLGPWLPTWRAHALRLSILTVSLGATAGAAWEIAEWLVRELTARESVTHSLDDAITDMMLGGFGSAASLAMVYWCVRSRELAGRVPARDGTAAA
jgi:hypothetical protein